MGEIGGVVAWVCLWGLVYITMIGCENLALGY